jgi:polyhydroxybutyrate depolymerase
VHVAGHSNGGMMAMRLGCEAPERLRSLAAVSASLPEGLACSGADRPLATLLIRGSADPYLPLAGGLVKGEERRGSVISADATLAAFARRNGCTSAQTRRVTNTSVAEATPATLTTYRRCTGAPTAAISLAGSGHGWPGVPYGARMTEMIGPAAPSFRGSAVIARFFTKRELP